MISFFARFSRAFALIAIALVFSLSAQAAQSDYVTFKVNCRGALDDIKAQGYSPMVIGYAVDGNGDELAPGEFETYKGSVLRVPKSALKGKNPADIADAKSRFTKIVAAHNARRAKIGPKKYDAHVNDCNFQLAPPPIPTKISLGNIPEKISGKVGTTQTFKGVYSEDSRGFFAPLEVSLDPKVGKVSYNRDQQTLTVNFTGNGNGKLSLVSRLNGQQLSRDVPTTTTPLGFWEKFGNSILSYAVWGLVVALGLLLIGLMFVRRRDRTENSNSTARPGANPLTGDDEDEDDSDEDQEDPEPRPRPTFDRTTFVRRPAAPTPESENDEAERADAETTARRS